MKKAFLAVFGFALSFQAAAQAVETGSDTSFVDFGKTSWRGAVGAGAAVVPRYEGSSSNRVRFVPLLSLETGRVFIGTMRGAGLNLSDDPDLKFGPHITYSRGRRQSDDPRLAGMGDVSSSAEAGLFFDAHHAPWYMTSDARTGRNGTRLELGGGYEARLAPGDRIRLGARIDWANAKYMQTYFGVNPAQSAASGLPVYSAGSGIKDYGIHASWNHAFSRNWFSNMEIQVRQLAGSAKSSPLSVGRTESSASFLVGYRF